MAGDTPRTDSKSSYASSQLILPTPVIPETGWMIAAVLGPATGAACRATTSGTDGDLDAAMAQETVFGLAKMESGETAEGAARFAAGEGRHGTFR